MKNLRPSIINLGPYDLSSYFEEVKEEENQIENKDKMTFKSIYQKNDRCNRGKFYFSGQKIQLMDKVNELIGLIVFDNGDIFEGKL